MEYWDAVDLVLSAYKDKLNKELTQKFREEYIKTLEADADMRRAKVSADIHQMAKLKMELKKFELTYSQLKRTTGSITAIDTLINRLNCQIREISLRKNRKTLN